MELKDKKIVVTGGGGFLGGFIVAGLKKRGVPGGYIHIPRTKDGIDFRRQEDCEKYFAKTKPDVVIHCAANQGGIGYHSGRQADLMMDNIRMGFFLMEAARAAGVSKFVNIVAGCSYPGYLEKDELQEENYWDGPLHESIFSYGFSRKASVVYSLALKKQFGFNSINLLLANMFGPGEHFNPGQSKALAGLIRKFYEAKRDNAPSVVVWGTGKPVRDWLYVKDGAEGILRATEVYDDVEPLNIASGIGISVSDLAHMIKDAVGYNGEIVYDTSRPDGALKKTFSIHHMKDKLNWIPTSPLKEAIRKTVEWFRANYSHAVSH